MTEPDYQRPLIEVTKNRVSHSTDLRRHVT